MQVSRSKSEFNPNWSFNRKFKQVAARVGVVAGIVRRVAALRQRGAVLVAAVLYLSSPRVVS